MKALLSLCILFLSPGMWAQTSAVVADLSSGKTTYQTVKGLHKLTLVDLKSSFDGDFAPITFSEVYKDQAGLSCRVFGRFDSNQSVLKYVEGSALKWQADKAYDNGVIPPYQFVAKAELKDGLVLKLASGSLQYSKTMSKVCETWITDGMLCDDQGICQPTQKCAAYGDTQVKNEAVSFAVGLQGKKTFSVDCTRQMNVLGGSESPDMQLNDLNLLSPILRITAE